MPAPAAPLTVAHAPPRLPLRVVGRFLAYAALIGLPAALVYGLGLYAIARFLP
jgi:hypothetical protein